jgi:hypothetical protein
MTLTVRLKPEIESALELHCAERGVTKSLVVQEVLAEYLVRPQAKRSRRRAAAAPEAMPVQPSAAYKAFARAGFIGGDTSDGASATKEVVRERIQQHFVAKKRQRLA